MTQVKELFDKIGLKNHPVMEHDKDDGQTTTRFVLTRDEINQIKDLTGNAATHNVTINRNSTDTIDGLTSITINAAYGGYELAPVTGGWIILP